MKKTLSVVLALAMLIGMLPMVAMAAEATGQTSAGMYSASNNRITGDITGANPSESVVLQLYSGATKIATTTLSNTEYFTNAATALTWCFCITGTSGSWNTEWETGMPRADLKPDKVVLYIDGTQVDEDTVTLHQNNHDQVGEEAVWAELEGVNPAPVDAPVYGGPVMNQNKVAAAQNGYVKTSPLAASEGATITIYSFANEGFELASVTVTDKNGEALELTKNSAGRWTYKVPAGGVTVTPVFAAK